MLAKTTATKLLASVALVAGAAGVAGLGTFGEFTDSTTSANNKVASGTIELDGATATTINVENLLPGETRYATFNLTQPATSEDFRKVMLSSQITATQKVAGLTLDEQQAANLDAAGGVEMTIRSCSVAWAADNTCPGTAQDILVKGDITQPGLNILPKTALNSGGQGYAYLQVGLELPGTATNKFQGITDTIQFTFTAHQKVTAGVSDNA